MAPAPGYTANLFTGCELRQSDTPISRITSNLPQIDAVRTRLMKSRSWIDSVGASTNFWDVDHTKRRHSILFLLDTAQWALSDAGSKNADPEEKR